MAFKVQWAVGDVEQLRVSFFYHKMFDIQKDEEQRIPCAQKLFEKHFQYS